MKKSNIQFVVYSVLATLIIIWSGLGSFGQGISNAPKTAEPQINNLSLLITDKDNKFVTGIGKEELSIFVDGKELVVESIAQKASPIIYIMAVDNSGSMHPIMAALIEAASAMIKTNDGDFVAIMRFVSKDKISITPAFSKDPKYLMSVIDGFYNEGGQTALTDAIFESVKVVSEQKGVGEGFEREVVVFSDGEDRISDHKEAELKDLLRQVNVRVFFVGLINELEGYSGLWGKGPKEKAKKYIETVTNMSGGASIFPKKNDRLSEVAKQIAALMKTKYVLAFKTDGKLDQNAKIEVKLVKGSTRKDLTISFRREVL